MTTLRLLLVICLLALAGWGVVLAKEYSEQWVVELIRDEVQASCEGCDLTAEAIEILPFSLRAFASGVRVTRGTDLGFTIDEVRARISLYDLLHGTLHLTNLHLLGVEVFEVDERSVLYKFIDRLTTASPPGEEPLVAVELHSLVIERGRLHQKLGRFELVGDGVSLEVIRNAQDNFDLLPEIKETWIHEWSRASQPKVVRSIFLGALEGLVTIRDEDVVFQQVDLIKGSARLRLGGVADTARENLLTGSIRGGGDARAMELTDFFLGQMNLEGSLGGTLERPTIGGQFASGKDTSFSLVLTESIELPLRDIFANFYFRLVDDSPEVKVRGVSGEGEGLRILPSSFIDVDEKGVILGADAAADSLDLFGVGLGNVRLHAGVIVPEAAATQLTIQGEVENINLLDAIFDGASFLVDFANDTMILNVVSKVPPDMPGFFRAHAKIRFLAAGGIVVEEADYEVKEARPYIVPLERAWSEISANGSFRSGSLALEGQGSVVGKVLLSADNDQISIPFAGTTLFDHGLLLLKVASVNETMVLDAKFGLGNRGRGDLTLSLRELQPPFPSLVESCFGITGEAKYGFEYGDSLAGSGKISDFHLNVGCAEVQAVAQAQARTPLMIRDGSLVLDGISVRGPRTELQVGGEVGFKGGWRSRAKGSLNLETLGELLPMVDEIRGNINAEISIDGPLSAPSLAGQLALDDASMAVARVNLQMTDAQGLLLLANDKIEVKTLSGTLNEGSIDVSGMLYPFNFPASEIRAELAEILISPTNDISLSISGDIKVLAGENWQPRIEGTVAVTGAEFSPQIGLQNIVKAIIESLVRTESTQSPETRLPPFELGLKVLAPQGIFVTTSWAEAELKGEVDVAGTLASPRLSGEVQALSGWFGFRDRKFYISAAQLNFRPDRLIPQLDLLGEANLMSRTGENVLVLVEVVGDLTSPRVILSSDRGLSQSELLAIMAGFDRPAPSGFGQSLGVGLRFSEVSLLSRESPYVLERFFYRLFSLDNLAIEPQLDSFTGTLQPAIIADKRLTEDLTLHGAGLFSSAYTQSEARVDYELLDTVTLSGALRSVSALYPLAIEGNLSWVVLAPQSRLISIDVDGNERLRASRVIGFTRLKENTRLPITELDRIRNLVIDGYRGQGFFDTQVQVACVEGEVDCNKLKISVDEGRQSRVRKVIVRGDAPAEIFSQSVLGEIRGRAYATQEYLDMARDVAIRLLRREGYLGARVSATFDDSVKPGRRDVVLDMRAGRPVSFVFVGATEFAPEDFLATLDLFGRRQPFGNNSVMILLQNMSRLYQDAGFHAAKLSHSVSDDQATGRRIYTINIAEGAKFSVGRVTIIDGETVPESEVIKAMMSRGYSRNKLLYPSRIVDEDVKNKEAALRDAYAEFGYPEAKVVAELQPDNERHEVNLIFRVEPGQPAVFKSLRVEGVPVKELEPIGLTPPISRAKVNTYVENLLDGLAREGYVAPWVDVAFDQEQRDLVVVTAHLAKRAVIGSIIVEGCQEVEVVLSHLGISAGMPLREETLSAARRRLLKLGLFARVEIRPNGEEGKKLDVVPLVVRVVERPLRSVTIGAGANSALGIHLFGEAVDRELWRDGRSLSARADLYYEPTVQEITQGVANLLYSNPRFLQSDLLHTESLTYQRSTQFNQEFQLGRLSLGSTLFDNQASGLNLSLGHTLNLENIFDVSQDAVLSDLDQGNLTLSIVNGLLGYDHRNDPLNPSSGWYAGMDWRLSTRAIGSQANYLGGGGRLSAISTLDFLSDRWSVAYLGQGGLLETFGGTSEVPITQRFYLGGRNTVRGFRENSLGPRGEAGSVLGGDTFIMNSAELRYRVAEYATVNLFLDIGNVYLRSVKMDLSDQREAVGVGTRFISPVGPIGFDIGLPLDERSGEPSLRFHFTVGSQY